MGEVYFPRAAEMRCVFATLFSLVICLQSNDYNISEYIRHFYTFMFSIKMTIFIADEIISLCLTGTRAIQLILSVKYHGGIRERVSFAIPTNTNNCDFSKRPRRHNLSNLDRKTTRNSTFNIAGWTQLNFLKWITGCIEISRILLI
ncbi:hypothetical protein BDFB_004106 [Asbolus verrucosus]|uniref:Uncharacterized protein n=1 Tax=Asbolus verrucosus TaxID=1661398 RepID=A0A482VI02_ASBVE|nr:hypothetical protein BDFB_004106 [Asbolus verrucosus]